MGFNQKLIPTFGGWKKMNIFLAITKNSPLQGLFDVVAKKLQTDYNFWVVSQQDSKETLEENAWEFLEDAKRAQENFSSVQYSAQNLILTDDPDFDSQALNFPIVLFSKIPLQKQPSNPRIRMVVFCEYTAICEMKVPIAFVTQNTNLDGFAKGLRILTDSNLNKICFVANETQYFDHLFPLWKSAKNSGWILVPFKIAIDLMMLYEIPLWCSFNFAYQLYQNDGPVVVSSSGDFSRIAATHRPKVLMEHGAGQTYLTKNSSYAGGSGRESATLLLSPGPYSLEKNKQAYPNIDCFAPGCPKIDSLIKNPLPNNLILGISFHWDCRVTSETRSAFEHYKPFLVDLSKQIPVIFHSHPRNAEVEKFCIANHLRFVKRFEDIVKLCMFYACDNSSTLFEFASCGRPVIQLNAPWYRKNLHHGLRFWEFADYAPSVDKPEQIVDQFFYCVDNFDAIVERQNQFLTRVYNNLGTATEKTLELLEKLKPAQKEKKMKSRNIPTHAMIGAKRVEEVEGPIFAGMLFYPGWYHQLKYIGPKRTDFQALPTHPVSGLDPEVRTRQFEQRRIGVRTEMPGTIEMGLDTVQSVALTDVPVGKVRQNLAPALQVSRKPIPIVAPTIDNPDPKTPVVDSNVIVDGENHSDQEDENSDATNETKIEINKTEDVVSDPDFDKQVSQNPPPSAPLTKPTSKTPTGGKGNGRRNRSN